MAYLLDTNVLIDFTLGRSLDLLRKMDQQPKDTLFMSAVTFAELAVGARRSTEASDGANLAALARLIHVRPFEERAGEIYGEICRAMGIKRSSFDRLIAAHAIALGFTLVTNNGHDFRDVPGLIVENWATA